jgi:excisionase family DNA binding protein
MTQTERPTLSVAETASLLGISRWLVQQAVHDGSLPSVRVGASSSRAAACSPGSTASTPQKPTCRLLRPTRRVPVSQSGAGDPHGPQGCQGRISHRRC